jgi:tetraacyldisaccharide 4'-kinase
LKPPGFWSREGVLPLLLSPAAAVTARLTARRMARPGWRAPVPVFCAGNVTVGGSGKTTLALDLLARLASQGLAPHALLRGYGGASRGVRRVQPDDDAALVGDEALLLAAAAPTWIGGDRAASARAAVAAGAQAVVLDDGLQNPTLAKDVSFLVIDGGFGFGNGRLLPAGPLRESVAAGAARCRAAVLIGEDATGASALLPPSLPVLRARLVPDAAARALAGQRVFAFAGIGRPDKFFATLRACGADVVGTRAFADHHRYTASEIERLQAAAARLDAVPVTTAKDAVRLDPGTPISVAGISLGWEAPEMLDAMLAAQPAGCTPA